jgi:hypothetical protein
MTARLLQSAWRFSRNELSGKSGAVQKRSDRIERRIGAPWLIAVTLAAVTLMPAYSYAKHEQWIIGEMRDADPAAKSITSVSGTCVPSHDREKLDCYFTTFSLARTRSDETLEKGYQEIQQELRMNPTTQIQDMRKGACTGDMSKPPAPLLQSVARVNDRLNLPPERSFESPPTHVLSLYGFPAAVPASLPWSTPSLGLSSPAFSFSRRR